MFAGTSPFSPRTRRSLLRQSQPTPAPDTPPFSKLLTSVLGSPFLTTSDLPAVPDFDLDVVDGAFDAVPGALAVTRPTSPSLGFSRKSYSLKSGKGLLPRIWDALSSPGKKGKGKSKRTYSFDDLPLDGEEGELIDDEACFIYVTAVTGTGTY